jgi:hypothetical protein
MNLQLKQLYMSMISGKSLKHWKVDNIFYFSDEVHIVLRCEHWIRNDVVIKLKSRE